MIKADPVGATEIAWRLHLGRTTVERWQQRHKDFPQRTWTVCGRPAWDWPDVEAWLIATGRLPGASAPMPRRPWVTIHVAAVPRSEAGTWLLQVDVDGAPLWRTESLGYGRYTALLHTPADATGRDALAAAQHALVEVAAQAESVTITAHPGPPQIEWVRLGYLHTRDALETGHTWLIPGCDGTSCRVAHTAHRTVTCELQVTGPINQALPTDMIRAVDGWRGSVRREDLRTCKTAPSRG